MVHEKNGDTLHSCEACQGEGCPWCDGGLQNHAQFTRWSAFRQKMRHTSNTYTFLQAIVLDVLDRLREDGSHLAQTLEEEGRALFASWVAAEGGRNEITESLKAFSKKALDYLQAR